MTNSQKPKKAKNHDEAWKIQEQYKGLPHGWIQWKNTSACLDFYCSCGKQFHFDTDFLYFVKCNHCKKVFYLNAHVEAIELEEEPTHSVHEGIDNDE